MRYVYVYVNHMNIIIHSHELLASLWRSLSYSTTLARTQAGQAHKRDSQDSDAKTRDWWVVCDAMRCPGTRWEKGQSRRERSSDHIETCALIDYDKRASEPLNHQSSRTRHTRQQRKQEHNYNLPVCLFLLELPDGWWPDGQVADQAAQACR